MRHIRIFIYRNDDIGGRDTGARLKRRVPGGETAAAVTKDRLDFGARERIRWRVVEGNWKGRVLVTSAGEDRCSGDRCSGDLWPAPMTPLRRILGAGRMLLVQFALFSTAWTGEMNVRSIGIQHGFSQTRISAITQDSSGFIWIGTSNGLVRFDGYASVQYRSSPTDSTTLTANDIHQLLVDREGTLWVRSGGGVDRFSARNGTAVRYREMAGDGIPAGRAVSSVYEDLRGDVWIIGDGIARFDRTSGRFIARPMVPGAPASGRSPRVTGMMQSKFHPAEYWLTTAAHGIFRSIVGDDRDGSSGRTEATRFRPASDTVYSLLEDRGGRIWVTHSHGIEEFDRTSASFAPVAPDRTPAGGGIIPSPYFLRDDGGGALWIWGTDAHGITWYDPRSGQGKTFSVVPGTLGADDGNWLTSLLIDEAGDVWIGTSFADLYAFDRGSESFRSIGVQNPPGQRYAISSLFQDRSGAYWIGTEGGGLYCGETRSVKFGQITLMGDDMEPQSLRDVRALHTDTSGTVWIGTLDRGLIAVSRREGRTGSDFREIRLSGQRAASRSVGSIVPGGEGTLWIGSWIDGFFHYDPGSGRSRNYRHDAGSRNTPTSDRVRTLFRARDGMLWIGMWETGLSRFDPATEMFTHYASDTGAGSLSDNTVYVIAEDRSGSLWVGTKNGLNRFDPRTQSFTRFQAGDGGPGTLLNDDIRALYQDRDDVLWIGTSGGGLHRYDERHGTFSAVTSSSGLPDDNVYGILGDENGSLWLSTHAGVCRVDPATGTIRTFTIADGLQSSEFNTGACHTSREGEMFFGGVAGVNVFFPGEIGENPYRPPVAIISVRVLERNVSDWTAGLDLRHDQDFLSVEFAALSYVQPERNRYRYTLEGLESRWHDVGTRRYAGYSHLSPGAYVFRVQAANNDGVWSDREARLAIVIRPPLWRTWWFYTISGIVLVGSLVLTVRRLSRRKLQQELEAAYREQEIVRERARISKDMHDEIGASLTRIAIVSAQLRSADGLDGKLGRGLESISTTAREVIQGMNEIIWALNPRNTTLDGLASYTRASVQDYLEAAGIPLSAEIPERLPSLPLSPGVSRNVFLVVKEAVHNAVKHSRAGNVAMRWSLSDGALHVSLEDDGVGFDPAHPPSGGNGLSNMRHRAAEANARLTVRTAPGEGMTILLSVPIPASTTGDRRPSV